MQSPDNRERLRQLGVPEKKIILTGNLKYDIHLETEAAMEKVIERLGTALQTGPTVPVLVCGSTMPGEEPMILDCFSFLRERFPQCRLILAPRHPERFPEVAELLSTQPFNYHPRSRLDNLPSDKPVDILLLDSIGELAHVYRLATLVFIGGSLVDFVGHNILEPAYLGKAIFFGPYMRNFQDIADTFLRSHGARQVHNLEELKNGALEILAHPAVRHALGEKAAGIMRENGGAVERTLHHLRRLM
jgi:3-deoxy-D-manno-octulosonic-acid transferase